MNPQEPEVIDEQLTAYLDGELSAAERERLEKQLVDDERMRVRLAELRRAVELLDELPETPHGQQFTKSTLELVVKDLTLTQRPETTIGPVVVRSGGLPTWARWGGLLIVLFAAGAAGGFATNWWQTRQELQELNLVANLPGLMDVNELAVAIELSKDRDIVEYLNTQLSDRTIPSMPNSLSKRRVWVQSLTPLQAAKLEAGRDMARKIERDTYSRLSAITQQIKSRPDSQAIEETIRVVGIVLDMLPSARRQDLQGLTHEQRVKSIREQMFLQAAMFYTTAMSPEDAKALEDWSTSSFMPALMASLPGFPRRENLDVKWLVRTLWFRRPIEEGYRLDNQDELLAELSPNMSSFGKRLLEGIAKNDQLPVISTWLVPDGMQTTARLVDVYDKMKRGDNRDEIDLMDPVQSRRLLEEKERRPTSGNRPR